LVGILQKDEKMGLLSFLFFIGVVGNCGEDGFSVGEGGCFLLGKEDARIGKAPHIYVYIRLTHRFRWGVPLPLVKNRQPPPYRRKTKLK
jgi:hypothetical protein